MNDSLFITLLFVLLVILFALSAFFSGSETALMSLDRYKLRHMAKRNKNAALALRLLKEPDRLIGVILLGNNLVNILITQLATYLGYRLAENVGVAIATGLLTLLLLIFAELTPKTLAVVKSEKIAYPAARIFIPLLKITSPVVWLVNYIANALIRKMGIDPQNIADHTLDKEELRTIVTESGETIPDTHQEMLLSVLDLEKTTVEDIMIPRQDISSIDLNNDWQVIEKQLIESPFTRLLMYRHNHDDILGFIHLRKLLPYFKENNLTQESLESSIRSSAFTLESTPLSQQLLNFQSEEQRIALVVDEYGDIQGLITLEDILEEIVGQFSTDPDSITNTITMKDDGTFWVDGGIHIRELNRVAKIELPIDGPKTMNGLIIEYLEAMPIEQLTVLINSYPLEIRNVKNNTIETLIIHPKIKNHGKKVDTI